MVLHVCPRCNYQTSNSSHYKSHVQRKTACKCVTGTDISQDDLISAFGSRLDDKGLKCEGCNMVFNSRSTKCRHKKTCERYRALSEGRNTSVENQGCATNVVGTSGDNSNVTINNTTNNTTNIYLPHAFGEEDVAHLSASNPEAAKFLLQVLHDRQDGLMNLISKIHFDEAHPENHNLRKRDEHDNFVQIYDGQKWSSKFVKTIAQAVFAKMKDIIASFFEAADKEETYEKIRDRWMFDPYRLWHSLQETRGTAYSLTAAERELRDGPCPERTEYSGEDLDEIVRRVNRGRLQKHVYDRFQACVSAPLRWEGGPELSEREKRVVDDIYEHFKRVVYENSEHLFPKPW
jgi:hypothetical protein